MHRIAVTVAPAESCWLKRLLPQNKIRIIGFPGGVDIAEVVGGIYIDGSSPGMIAQAFSRVPVDMPGDERSIHGLDQTQEGDLSAVYRSRAVFNISESGDKVIRGQPMHLNVSVQTGQFDCHYIVSDPYRIHLDPAAR